MTHRIVTFGEDALRRKAQPVIEITPAIKQLAQDMLETMRAARGVGLAAEQVGRDESICVIEVPREAEIPECVENNSAVAMPLVMINPEITGSEGKQRAEEGCLSFPDISVPVTRARQVTAAYTDLEGKRLVITVQGLLARAVQHELDHLEGVLLVDRMSAVQRLSVAGQLKRLRRGAQKASAGTQ
ncbi:MAG: peptide deformylase [Kiritimatiellae bacterium]|nr:peptide deformylase [Kiritimatiellia bacterium]